MNSVVHNVRVLGSRGVSARSCLPERVALLANYSTCGPRAFAHSPLREVSEPLSIRVSYVAGRPCLVLPYRRASVSAGSTQEPAMGAQRAPPPMRRKARHRAGRRKVLRYGLPLLGLVLAGYGGLTLFVGGRFEAADAHTKRMSEREYQLQHEYERAMKKLDLEELELKPIPRRDRDREE